MIAIIFAFLAGTTIVWSRSINGLLASRSNRDTSTFFNYFTGTLGSLVLLFICTPFVSYSTISFNSFHPIMLLGGVIGVFNIMILNTVVLKISAVKLTLLAFIGQLTSGMIIDFFFYELFSITKLIGCILVTCGLILYQQSDQ